MGEAERLGTKKCTCDSECANFLSVYIDEDNDSLGYRINHVETSPMLATRTTRIHLVVDRRFK